MDSIVTRMKRLREGGMEVDLKTSPDELLQNYQAVEAQSSECPFSLRLAIVVAVVDVVIVVVDVVIVVVDVVIVVVDVVIVVVDVVIQYD